MVNICLQSSNERLLNLIKIKRSELINLAASNELSSNNVVKCSQELDLLIYEFQELYKGKSDNKMEIREMDGIH
ncbi:aspartyl-phosphate phosphatase Spo0E family protein [Neobacillus sp. LXY-4]|uniref:aspartyl-phosphate phosphatase Spo0E family protein n=1 Tax=Neobacillus sp. LXY-4 TaxID=3379826 RepID=UPI003EDFD69F